MFNRPRFVTHLQQISIEPLDFPVFSVTKTLIKAFTQNLKRNLIPEVSAFGIFFVEQTFHFYSIFY